MNEEIRTIYQRLKPAQETLEKFDKVDKKFDHLENTMNNLSTDFKLMKQTIETICEKLDQNAEEHKQILSKIDGFIETADKRYAEKSIEDLVKKILWGIGFIVIGAIATAVFRLIFK